ncbi:MAG: serine dehydratase [Pirellulaceae bacterium]|nr:serine dehydratase [Pirellulaceae bacterium]
MIVSIFNDVIGPVMRGPSSSHCAAALRIGRIARDLMDGKIDSVLVQFDNNGSLPATHTSQGSDMGLFGGLLGWDADDPRLPDSHEHLREAGIELKFEYGDFDDAHPNTYRLSLSNHSDQHTLIAISTGGGMFQVQQIDGVTVDIGGDYHETLIWDKTAAQDPELLRTKVNADDVHVQTDDDITFTQIKSQTRLSDHDISQAMPLASDSIAKHLAPVLPVQSRRGLRVPFQSCAEMLRYDDGRDLPLWQLALDYETARSSLSETAVINKMTDLVSILRNSIQEGLAGTHYQDRVLGFQSGEFQRMMDDRSLLDGGMLNRIVLYTTAMMEVKSSMGVIIAAPTAGACAALPATCIAAGETMQLSDDAIARGMLAAGMIGVFIATHWSFAAEVGGCQAEGGSAAAMSAAALVTFAHGSLAQSTGAASMAMQNMLGLICDPVANRVEVPCLGKNVMAASNALSCANMAIAGFDCVIPLDETIQAAKEVALRMPREHRCTALGGLATTPTSLALEKRLAGGCGTGCGCGPTVTKLKMSSKTGG